MKVRLFLLFISLLTAVSLHAQDKGRYVEVTGNSEIEIVPDKTLIPQHYYKYNFLST